jgi:hypothetical protein
LSHTDCGDAEEKGSPDGLRSWLTSTRRSAVEPIAAVAAASAVDLRRTPQVAPASAMPKIRNRPRNGSHTSSRAIVSSKTHGAAASANATQGSFRRRHDATITTVPAARSSGARGPYHEIKGSAAVLTAQSPSKEAKSGFPRRLQVL